MKWFINIILLLCLAEVTLAQEKGKDAFSVVNSEGQTLYYQILSETDHTVALTKGKEKYKDVKYIIPESVNYNGSVYTVTEIGDRAFLNCRKLKEIIFPNTIKRIKEFAFCRTGMYDLRLPDSVEYIGNRAFAANSNLKTMHIPINVKQIEEYGIFVSPLVSRKFKGYISELPRFITSANCEAYGLSKEAVIAYQTERQAKQQSMHTPQVIYVQPNGTTLSNDDSNIQNVVSENKRPSSDVDINIPLNSVTNANTFAAIIANENYQDESKVSYAINDGEMFKTYCKKVLGLPEENIHFRRDATLNNILSEINWLENVAKAYKGEAKLIVYYAGHGIPDEASGLAYLLPVDGKGNLLATGYSLTNLYKTLGELPVKNITVFMDACFSGAQRNGKMLASARGVAIKVKPETPKGKIVVFSAAQGDETAYPYNDKEHGLFTYYLLKKLQETKGDVTYLELAEYIQQQVSRKSIVANGKSQTPTVVPSVNIGGEWKNMKIK